jgi:HPt (histidine-containing phosphotransfer) domain-containing protein
LFLESSPPLLAEIELASPATTAPPWKRAAHALKGAMQSISAVPAAQAASKLEEIARMGTTDEADKSLSVLKLEFERLVLTLSETSKGHHHEGSDCRRRAGYLEIARIVAAPLGL